MVNTSEVIALAGWSPEVLAYAYAKYSRSPLSIRESIKRITAENSSKFLDEYYFQFGHASIADNAHIPLAFENISQIAAFFIEDEQLWDGQERSTRFQKFHSASGYYIPYSVRGTFLEARYAEIAELLLGRYAFFSEQCFEWLAKTVQKPPDMKDGTYERTLRARAFDVARYWLFGGILTSVGQITSARTLESQICRLMSSEYPELQKLGQTMKDACTSKPFCPDGKDEPPMAPTLVKYTAPNEYLISLREKMRVETRQLLWGQIWGEPDTGRYVKLIDPMSLSSEVVATLLYEASNYRFQDILYSVSQCMTEDQKQKIIDLALEDRGPHDPLPKAFASGYQIQYDVVMDRGGERDLHRHRNCIQIHQPLTIDRGYDVPPMIYEVGLADSYSTDMATVRRKIGELKEKIGVEADYLIPFAFRSATLYKMDLRQAAYMTELRSGVKGHFSYREIACEMHRQLIEKYPMLADRFRVTPFEQIDLLKR